MNVFVSSDYHFNHKNISKYCPESRGQFALYAEDGKFLGTDFDAMHTAIIDRHNSMVGINDHTYILGDIGFGSVKESIDSLSKMNGIKTIILGNHDRSLVKSGLLKDKDALKQARIVEVDNYKVISRKINGSNIGVVLFHHTIANWDGMHHGSIHLWGHEHGNGPIHPGRGQDVGVDTNSLYPYNMDKLLEELIKKPISFSGHHDGTR